MIIDNQYMIFYLTAIVFFPVTIFKIFTAEICMSLTLTFKIGQGQMCIMSIESQYMTSDRMTILIFVLSVTISKIFTVYK